MIGRLKHTDHTALNIYKLFLNEDELEHEHVEMSEHEIEQELEHEYEHEHGHEHEIFTYQNFEIKRIIT